MFFIFIVIRSKNSDISIDKGSVLSILRRQLRLVAISTTNKILGKWEAVLGSIGGKMKFEFNENSFSPRAIQSNVDFVESRFLYFLVIGLNLVSLGFVMIA